MTGCSYRAGNPWSRTWSKELGQNNLIFYSLHLVSRSHALAPALSCSVCLYTEKYCVSVSLCLCLSFSLTRTLHTLSSSFHCLFRTIQTILSPSPRPYINITLSPSLMNSSFPPTVTPAGSWLKIEMCFYKRLRFSHL